MPSSAVEPVLPVFDISNVEKDEVNKLFGVWKITRLASLSFPLVSSLSQVSLENQSDSVDRQISSQAAQPSYKLLTIPNA